MSCDAAVRLEALVIQSLFIVLPQRGTIASAARLIEGQTVGVDRRHSEGVHSRNAQSRLTSC